MKIFIITALALSGLLSINANARQASAESCRHQCSPGCEQYAYELQSTVRNILQTCGINEPTRPGRRGQLNKVEFFHDDKCSSAPFAIADQHTSCRSLANESDWVRSVRANGVCHYVPSDTSLGSACEAYRDIGASRTVEFYFSDSCSDSLVAAASSKSRCEEIIRIGGIKYRSVWAVKIGGRCINIDNTTFEMACPLYAN
jgi:hypothetical protein